MWRNRFTKLPCVVHPCYVPVNPAPAVLCVQRPVNSCGKHCSRADNDLEVTVSLRKDRLFVEVSQDVQTRNILPVCLWRQSLGGWRRQHEIDGEHVILKPVALVGTIFLLQQQQQLYQAGNRITRQLCKTT